MGLEIPEQQKLWSSFRLDLRQMLDSSFIALQWVFNKRWARFIKAGHPKPWIPCGFSPRTGGMHKIIKSILWGRKKGWKDVNIECNLFSCLLESSSCFIHNPLKLQKSCPTPGLFNQKQQGRNFPKKGRENCEAQNLPKKGSAGIFLKKKHHHQVGSKQIIGDLAIQRVASQAGFPFLLLILVPWKQLYEVTLIGESNL